MDKKIIDRIINKCDIEELCTLIQNGNIKENIIGLKKIDFLVDIRGSNKYNDVINLLQDKFSVGEVAKYINEIKVINNIFAECAKLQNEINIVPPRLIFPLMLHWGSYNIDKYKSPKALKFFKEQNANKIIAYERNAELTIQAIKSLMYNDRIYDGNKFIYNIKSSRVLYSKFKFQKCIMDYIVNSYHASKWYEKYEYWKKNIYGMKVVNENSIKLIILDKDALEEHTNPYTKQRISRLQFESSVINDYYFYKANQIHKKLDYKFIEYLSQRILDKHFYCDSSEVLVEDVKIKDWVKAYTTLFKISQFDIDAIMPSFNGFIADHIRCKSRKAWIKIFVKNGISLDSAEIIFDHLILHRGATDVYDYPFIPIKYKYIISRTISKMMHPAYSIISRFNSKDINIDIKGYNFEKNLYTFLDLAEIPYVQMHNKVDGKEYECDAIFYMNETFVFCECKSRTGHELETRSSIKYLDDINQLNRIVNFYKENMNLIFDAFEKKGVGIKNKKFYDIKKLVIHSGTVDGVIVKDNVYIMDFDSFIIPFDRGSIYNDYIRSKSLKKVFEGDVTIYKLFKFYNYDFCVYDYRNKIIYTNNKMQLGKFKFDIDDYYIEDFNEEISANEYNVHMRNTLMRNGYPEV